MKLRISGITLSGFGSFAREQEAEFPVDAGLYFLAGENRKSQDLGANGVGKSTFWNALCWALYGKTLDGVKGPSVKNWEGKSACFVEVPFEIDGAEHLLRRTQSPNSLTLDGENVEQKAVDDILGCSFSAFTHCVVMGQFSTYFIDLKPAAQLEAFTTALDLGFWEKASTAARALRDEQAREVIDIEMQEARNSGALESARENLREYLSGLQDRLDKMRDERSALIRRRKAIKRELRELPEVAPLMAKCDRIDALLRRTGRVVDEQRKLLAEAREEAAVSNYKTSEAEKAVALWDEMDGGCPTCGTHFSPKARKKLREEAQVLFEKRVRLGKKLDTRVKETSTALAEAKARETEYNERLESALEERDRVRSSKRKLTNELADVRKRIEDVNQSIISHEARRDKLEAGVMDLETKAADLAGSRIELDRKRLLYDAWVSGFKDLRLQIITGALAELEMHVNSGLVALGLDGWSVNFDVERASAKGSSISGFTVLISSPESKEPAPFTAWSGGEAQRLRIATEIGFADLIRNRTGFSTDLEVWDEPTAHLSDEGVDDLVRFFAQRARDDHKTLWLVDHRAPGHGDFVAAWKVIKDSKGSRLKVASI